MRVSGCWAVRALIACMLASRAMGAGTAVLDLGWGPGPGQAGYYNNRSPGFEEMAAMGPQDFLPLPDGGVILADTWNDRLLVFDAAAKPVRAVTDSLLKRPWLLGRSTAGELFVALGRGQHVVRLDASYRVKSAFGGLGEGPGRFGQLAGLEMDSQGHLVLCDLGRNSLELMDAEGRQLARLSWPGTGFALAPGDLFMDLEYEAAKGYTVRLRRASGEARYLFAMPGAGLEGGTLLGLDAQQRVYVRFTRASEPGWLFLARLDSTGRKVEDLGKLRHLPADRQLRVLPDGRLMWLEYDATAAPSGRMRLLSGQP